jgi:hypothetical protein
MSVETPPARVARERAQTEGSPVPGHARKPSMDRLKQKIAALNCYVSQHLDDGNSPAAIPPPVVSIRSRPASPPRSRQLKEERKGSVRRQASQSTPMVPLEDRARGTMPYLGHLPDQPPTEGDDRSGWHMIDPTRFAVRGPNYLSDHKKLPSELSVFEVAAVDAFVSERIEEVRRAAAGQAHLRLPTLALPPRVPFPGLPRGSV